MVMGKPNIKLSDLHLIAHMLARENGKYEVLDIAALGIQGWPWRVILHDCQSDTHFEAPFKFEVNAINFAKDYYYADYELWQRTTTGRLIKRATCVAGEFKYV